MPEGISLKSIVVLVLGLCLIFIWPQSQRTFPQTVDNTEQTESLLEINALGISAPIIFGQSQEEADIQKDLQSGVVHLRATAMPGQIGNVYIVGHSSDYWFVHGNYKTVFARLPQIKVGDVVTINYDNQTIEYMVLTTRVVEATDLSVLSQRTHGKRLLTLQTSYPVGTARQRFIVVAEQVEK